MSCKGKRRAKRERKEEEVGEEGDEQESKEERGVGGGDFVQVEGDREG